MLEQDRKGRNEKERKRKKRDSSEKKNHSSLLLPPLKCKWLFLFYHLHEKMSGSGQYSWWPSTSNTFFYLLFFYFFYSRYPLHFARICFSVLGLVKKKKKWPCVRWSSKHTIRFGGWRRGEGGGLIMVCCWDEENKKKKKLDWHL